MATLNVFTILIILNIIYAQNPSFTPSLSPTFSPITDCNDKGRIDGCTDTQTDPFNVTSSPTPSNWNGHIETLNPTMSPIINGTTTQRPSQSPVVLRDGRDDNITQSPSISTTKEPTISPLEYDLDTKYPTKSPTLNPTVFGYISPTFAPTLNTSSPTPYPTRSPVTTTALYTSTTATTKESTTSLEPTRSPIQDNEVIDDEYTTTKTANIKDMNEVNMTENELFDLTIILLLIFGILIFSLFCGILYFFYGRKRAKKRAKALKFRFDANKEMELDQIKSNSFDSDNNHFNNKKNTLLINDDGNDGEIRVPEMEPGESPINTNDIALNIMVNNEENVNSDLDIDVDEIMNNKITDDGNNNDIEVIDDDDIDKTNNFTSNGEVVDMEESYS